MVISDMASGENCQLTRRNSRFGELMPKTCHESTKTQNPNQVFRGILRFGVFVAFQSRNCWLTLLPKVNHSG